MDTNEPRIPDLHALCSSIRELISVYDYLRCENAITNALKMHPHAPQPHNLYGVVLEKQGLHTIAMRHFRAALALDPAYRPALYNLRTYGTFFSRGTYLLDDEDNRSENLTEFAVSYDAQGIGRFVRRSKGNPHIKMEIDRR